MKKFLLLLLIAFPFFSRAQNQSPTHFIHNQVWTQLNTKVLLSDSWSVMNEVHYRRAGYLKEMQQLILRPSVTYKISNTLSATGGYSFIQSSPYGNNPLPVRVNEHNVWEQLALNHSLGRLKLNHRYRWEHRFQDKLDEVENGVWIKDGLKSAMRFRYRISAVMPLFPEGETKGLYVHAFDEIFLNTTDGLGLSGFNQNWMYIGLGYQFNPDFKTQLGYKRQSLKGGGDYFEKNSTYWLTFNYQLDLRKKN